jgi:cytochrome c-type biogenesis protein CcmH
VRRRRRVSPTLVLACLGGLVVAIAVGLASFGSPSSADRARSLDEQLRCPVCQGVSIADSPSESATQMRAVVRERLAAGDDDDDVRAYFVARFGPSVLLAPPGDGLGGLLWVAPGASMLAGATVLLRRSRRRGPPGATGATAFPDPGRTGRPSAWSTVAAMGMLGLAVAVPLAVAIVPRLAGQEISGRPAAQGILGLSELEARVRAQPSDTSAALELGAAYLDAARPADAATTYTAVLRRQPDQVEAVFGLGVAFLDGGRPDAAIALFDRTLDIDPSLADAYLFRAIARIAIDGAISLASREDARRFAAMRPEDPRVEAARRLAGGGTP